jgi:hypothetical protein
MSGHLAKKDLDTSEFCLVPAEISRQARFSKHPENVLLISFLYCDLQAFSQWQPAMLMVTWAFGLGFAILLSCL